MSVYQLAILDNIAGFFLIVFLTTLVAAILCAVAGFMISDTAFSDEDAKKGRSLLKSAKRFLYTAILTAFISIPFPTRRALIESYLMTEGKDLATAENVELVLDRLDQRIGELAGKE